MAEERKLYPLTQAQGMLFLSWKYSYKKAIVNICSMVCFETEIDHKLMLQATYLGFARNEAASIRAAAEADIAQERKKAVNDLKNEIGGMAVEIAGKVVEREINEADHQALIDEFIRNVGDAS